jgi:putative oxidoreductase
MKALMCTCSAKWAEYAPLVLRLAVGFAFMLHGWQKINVMGHAGVTGFFTSLGIPAAGFFAFIVMWLEFLGGIGLILGLATHWFSKLLAIDMAVAIFAVHISNGFLGSTGKPGYELTLLLFAACVSLMITGAGKFSLDAKWNTKL